MAYGRADVTLSTFLEQALLVSYSDAKPGNGPLPKAGKGGIASGLSRRVYRAQIGSEIHKRARWFAETVVGPGLARKPQTRNTLMNEPVANLADFDRSRTDILHEYFLPPERLSDFFALCRKLIPNSGVELLNITMRYLAPDTVSTLSYAPTQRISNVMSFIQRTTPEGEAAMLRLTERLIEGVAGLGGSFYLPYRLHATPAQVRKIYPKTDAFIAAKRDYDPNLVFRNAMWPAYFAAEG